MTSTIEMISLPLIPCNVRIPVLTESDISVCKQIEARWLAAGRCGDCGGNNAGTTEKVFWNCDCTTGGN
jgi:hypothetical protein